MGSRPEARFSIILRRRAARALSSRALRGRPARANVMASSANATRRVLERHALLRDALDEPDDVPAELTSPRWRSSRRLVDRERALREDRIHPALALGREPPSVERRKWLHDDAESLVRDGLRLREEIVGVTCAVTTAARSCSGERARALRGRSASVRLFRSTTTAWTTRTAGGRSTSRQYARERVDFGVRRRPRAFGVGQHAIGR